MGQVKSVKIKSYLLRFLRELIMDSKFVWQVMVNQVQMAGLLEIFMLFSKWQNMNFLNVMEMISIARCH